MKNFKLSNFMVSALALFLLLACSQNNIKLEKFDANKTLQLSEKTDFIHSIIRLHGKLAPKATQETKFQSSFDSFYLKEEKRIELVYFVKKHTDDFSYALTYRVMPSIKLKKAATAIRFKTDVNGEITHYEEVFRTWKMEEKELKTKGDKLFTLLLEGKDLTPFYNQNSGTEEWIEFPDEYVRFDIQKRTWVSSLDDPLKDYYNMKD